MLVNGRYRVLGGWEKNRKQYKYFKQILRVTGRERNREGWV